MKKYLIPLITTLLIFSGAYFSYQKSSSSLYGEYMKLWAYRRMHPDTLPRVEITRLYTAGHDTTYADTIWISLVQYIGDNLSGDKYKTFLNPLIDRITKLHPHFHETYNVALILAPNLREESSEYEEDKRILRDVITL
jgi:hypothetical protein